MSQRFCCSNPGEAAADYNDLLGAAGHRRRRLLLRPRDL
jgi:hypothetical protein